MNYFKSILKSTHVEGSSVNTLYSNIFDLRNGIIYLYYWHQFDEVVILNVTEQIARGEFQTKISDLFSKATTDSALAEYQEYKKGEIVDLIVILAWLSLVVLFLIVKNMNMLRIIGESLRALAVWIREHV